MIVSPKIRGFICITSHPDGCAAHVQEQIDFVKSQPKIENGPKNVLVIGASAGYGLASRIVPAFSCGANTLGLFFETSALAPLAGTIPPPLKKLPLPKACLPSHSTATPFPTR